jgi:hypothetical protein
MLVLKVKNSKHSWSAFILKTAEMFLLKADGSVLSSKE